MSNQAQTIYPYDANLLVTFTDGSTVSFKHSEEERIKYQKHEHGLQVSVSHKTGVNTSFFSWHSIKSFHVRSIDMSMHSYGEKGK